MSGQGKLTYINGNIYEGEFLNNQSCGYGIYNFVDGGVYKGQFSNDMFNGQGKYSWANGDAYEGEFKNDELDGSGIKTWQMEPYKTAFLRILSLLNDKIDQKYIFSFNYNMFVRIFKRFQDTQTQIYLFWIININFVTPHQI
ncbi:TIR_domain-containing protein [Hexamita inflata]|uniref:TIR domain-containing protein n=1 Tax=Hexamita inflata TaxID=28002 RepID=A0AA86QFJ7_9EUKA|nr:TIR domain-containing protein [Hexamita inflata]CAI9957765.1 TIR domain-containing protein [Hexamita inflata]